MIDHSLTTPPAQVRIHLCVPDDQEQHMPRRRRAPRWLPREAPMPRIGELIYLSSSSAWIVISVVHEWRNPTELRVEVWLEFAGSARIRRPAGFALTQ